MRVGRLSGRPLRREFDMKFRFLGTEDCPESITLRGQDFPTGKPVEVDEELAMKLRNLDFFQEVKRGRRKNDKNEQ